MDTASQPNLPESVSTLVLVRHGETEWTEKHLLHGRLDSPLSATGRRHAAQAAAALKGQPFEAVYCSPRGRAAQTAAVIAEELGLTPQPLAGLAEADYGWLEGRSLRRWDPDPGTGKLGLANHLARLTIALTGEPLARFSRRVQTALDEVAARHSDGRTLLVTHWGVLSLAMAWLLHSDPAARRRFGPWAACGISEVRRNGAGWEAVRLNDRSHLA